jgi:acyl-coenzyme A synthetase/AMP-(fatty) acid ligase
LTATDTSGTTGFPKPITWTHSWVHSRAQEFLLPDIQNTDTPLLSGSNGGSKALFYFPAFHASGVIGMVLFPLLRGVVPVYPPTWTTPCEAIEGALAVLDVLAAEEKGDNRRSEGKVVDSISFAPPFIEYLGAHPDLLEKLSQGVETVFWAGGSVSRSAGNAVAAKMNVVNALASTEMGVWPTISRAGANMRDGLWEYMFPHSALNMRFVPISETTEGTVYEAVLVKNDGVEWDGYVQPLFKVYEGVAEKRLSDLFVQHPNDSTLWKHHGRADDLLVFLTNEKFHPAAAEQLLVSHPAIADCMLVGTRRPTASLILRLQDGGVEIPEDVWTLIEEVNLASPVYARVEREMVIVVDKPFARTAKGSVQKRAILELYKEEVDELYER